MNGMPYSVTSEVVPRLQWNANSGYCGETSFICAGLNFGQYCSQWTAREQASSLSEDQSASQLLVGPGTDDTLAAQNMRLKASEFNGSAGETLRFIVWMKSHLASGHVPIIGVYNNTGDLGEPASFADGQYDHIVPVLGWDSDLPIIDEQGVQYHPGDFITFSDNGLYGAPPQYPYLYRYQVGTFKGDRSAGSAQDGRVYTLPDKVQNCGIAIEGVLDDDGYCIPVRISSSTHIEPDRNPHLAPGSTPTSPLWDGPPASTPLRLTATVDLSGQNGQSGPWNLYRYDDFAIVPVQGFNAAAGDAAQQWSIPAGYGPTFTVEHDALSNETVVFRAVPASAP
jgi:hypothetical protein